MSQEIYVNMHGTMDSIFGFIVPKNITIKLYGYPGLITNACQYYRHWNSMDKSKLVIIGPGQYLFDIIMSKNGSKGKPCISYIIDDLKYIPKDKTYKDTVFSFSFKKITLSILCSELIKKYIDKDITIHVITCLEVYYDSKNMCDYLYKDVFNISSSKKVIKITSVYPYNETNNILSKYFSKFPKSSEDMLLSYIKTIPITDSGEMKTFEDNCKKNKIFYDFQFNKTDNIFNEITKSLKDRNINEILIPIKHDNIPNDKYSEKNLSKNFKAHSPEIYNQFIYKYNYFLTGVTSSDEHIKLYEYNTNKYNDKSNNKYKTYMIKILENIYNKENANTYSIINKRVCVDLKEEYIITTSNSTGGVINTTVGKQLLDFYDDYKTLYNNNRNVIIATYPLICDLVKYNNLNDIYKISNELNKFIKSVDLLKSLKPINELLINNYKSKNMDHLYKKLANKYKNETKFKSEYSGKFVDNLRTIQ